MKIPWSKQPLVQTDFFPELIEIVVLDVKRLVARLVNPTESTKNSWMLPGLILRVSLLIDGVARRGRCPSLIARLAGARLQRLRR
jgi:hypothetical protein